MSDRPSPPSVLRNPGLRGPGSPGAPLRLGVALCAGLPALEALAQPDIPGDLDFSEIFDWVIIAILIVSWLLPVLIGLAKKLREKEGEGFEKGEETALPKGSEPIEPS